MSLFNKHQHDWTMISKEFVGSTDALVGEVESKSTADSWILQQMIQGYWSYVFKCSTCGEVLVTRG